MDENKTKQILKKAVDALYFNDSSDYESALYHIVSIIQDQDMYQEDIEKLYHSLEKQIL